MAASAPKSDDEDSLERSFNSSVRSTTSGKRPLRHARSASSIFSQLPQVDSSILETVTLEHRDKFTVVFDHLFLCNFVQEKRVSYTFSFHANTTTTKSFYFKLFAQLYKVDVNNGDTNWVIYRRYGDFMLLNKKVIRSTF